MEITGYHETDGYSSSGESADELIQEAESFLAAVREKSQDKEGLVSVEEWSVRRDKKVHIVRAARWQNLIPSFPWIATGWRAWGRNPRKGRDQILQRSVAEP